MITLSAPTVQDGLTELSQREALVTLDELLSRRGHNHRELRHIVAVQRQERLAWRDARDRAAAKKEEAEDA